MWPVMHHASCSVHHASAKESTATTALVQQSRRPMDRDELREAVLPLPVWDTHTHLIGASLPARSFWEIGHYFWFLRELLAAGYPPDHDSLPEAERIDAFVRAFQATRNTAMNWTVRRIFRDLYGVTIADAASVRLADEAVRARAAETDWPER